ncbi:hypothetical protein PQR34_47325 [Paraburkholderia sediminicola]|uniref:hypothetical protein n=1 Tax=Paraburkholderia sediminicola TaxID=458836 RepID=UPI0038B7F55D
MTIPHTPDMLSEAAEFILEDLHASKHYALPLRVLYQRSCVKGIKRVATSTFRAALDDLIDASRVE